MGFHDDWNSYAAASWSNHQAQVRAGAYDSNYSPAPATPTDEAPVNKVLAGIPDSQDTALRLSRDYAAQSSGAPASYGSFGGSTHIDGVDVTDQLPEVMSEYNRQTGSNLGQDQFIDLVRNQVGTRNQAALAGMSKSAWLAQQPSLRNLLPGQRDAMQKLTFGSTPDEEMKSYDDSQRQTERDLAIQRMQERLQPSAGPLMRESDYHWQSRQEDDIAREQGRIEAMQQNVDALRGPATTDRPGKGVVHGYSFLHPFTMPHTDAAPPAADAVEAYQKAQEALSGQRGLLMSKKTHVDQQKQRFGLMTPDASPITTIPEGQTASNPKTGERLIYRNGKWVPAT